MNNGLSNGITVGTEEVRRNIRVVLADDHPIVRDGLRKLLMLEDDIEVVGEASVDRAEIRRFGQRRASMWVLPLSRLRW